MGMLSWLFHFLGAVFYSFPSKTVLHFKSQPLNALNRHSLFFRGPQSCRRLVRQKEALDVNRDYRPNSFEKLKNCWEGNVGPTTGEKM